jgi:hypothetical protein
LLRVAEQALLPHTLFDNGNGNRRCTSQPPFR